MKVVNRTRYRTRPLKALLVEVYRRWARSGIRVPQWAEVVVTVTLSPGKYDCQPEPNQKYRQVQSERTGLILTLPLTDADPLRVVREFEASLLWLYDGTLNTYPFPADSVLNDRSPWADACVGGGVLPQRPLPPKPKGQALLKKRYTSVKIRLALWERKRRRAETAIKKLRKQQRYYEKQLS